MKLSKIIASLTLATAATLVLTGCGNNAAGADEVWDASMPISIVSREEGSGTRGAFVELFDVEDADGNDATTIEAIIGNGTSGVRAAVAGDEFAIGYVSLGALDGSVTPLTVDGVEASSANVLSGDYGVARPFVAVVQEDNDNELVADFMAFIMSAQGQAVVADNGYVSIPDLPEFTGGNVSGSITIGGSTSVVPVIEHLLEAYNEMNPNVVFYVHSQGSGAGITGASEGTFDIGLSSRAVREAEIELGLVATDIAFDAIAVIVHNDNPTTDISAQAVTDIFLGYILNWNEVN